MHSLRKMCVVALYIDADYCDFWMTLYENEDFG